LSRKELPFGTPQVRIRRWGLGVDSDISAIAIRSVSVFFFCFVNKKKQNNAGTQMQGGIASQPARIYDMIASGGIGGITSVEMKTENDNRSKLLNDAHWKSVTAYNAIFDVSRSIHRDVGAKVKGTVTLSLLADFDREDLVLLNSIVGDAYPNGLHNRFPSVLLAIAEWIVEDAVKSVDGGALYPWLHPTVSITSSNDFVYVIEFELSGSRSSKAAVETALLSSIRQLSDRVLSYNRGITVGRVFDMSTPQSVLNLTGPTELAVTGWDRALLFVEPNDPDPRSVASRTDLSPLQRMVNTGTTEPTDSIFAAPASQPWAVGTVFKYTVDSPPLTLFAMATGPPTPSSGNTGIWVTIEGHTLALVVGESDPTVGMIRLTHTDHVGVWGKDKWIGLALVWNGHQSNRMDSVAVRNAYSLRFVDLVTGLVTNLHWDGIDINNGGGAHAIKGDTNRHLVGVSADNSYSGTDRHVFRGSIASHVATTLLSNVVLPRNDELSLLVRNPMQWLRTYKIGQNWRKAGETQPIGNFATDGADEAGATKIWLMGDQESSNADATLINNQVRPADNNEALQLVGFEAAEMGEDIADIPGLDGDADGMNDTWFVVTRMGEDVHVQNSVNPDIIIGSTPIQQTLALRNTPLISGAIVIRDDRGLGEVQRLEWNESWAVGETKLLFGSLAKTSTENAISFIRIQEKDGPSIFMEMSFMAEPNTSFGIRTSVVYMNPMGTGVIAPESVYRAFDTVLVRTNLPLLRVGP
jgi:hypothetical protein